MKILLLSAYDASSHRYWHQGLREALTEFEWTVLSLPARYFSWRIRGNPLSWIDEQKLRAKYDLLVATSMVDLATLRGLLPSLVEVPTLLYFHENQFAYPQSPHQFESVEPKMVSLYAALCADRLAFNSDYNRRTFLQGVESLLKKMPDGVPPGICERLQQKSLVLPVPLLVGESGAARAASGRLQIIWNHRWEYDKGPELLLEALRCLDPALPLTVHVVGQQFRTSPEVFEALRVLLQNRGWLGSWGFAEQQQYGQLLQSSHLVLSTAKHDFQGLAVLEAAMSGCVPLVPDRLAYPEFIPDGYRYAQKDEADVRDLCRRVELQCRAWQAGVLHSPPDLKWLSWARLAPTYRHVLSELVSQPRA